jgi:L-rhamnose mutarotase
LPDSDSIAVPFYKKKKFFSILAGEMSIHAGQKPGETKEQCKRKEAMERFAWKAKLLPGAKAEYIRRHDEIWPEMTELLNNAGIHNYTIWCVGDELFGYYEAEQGVDFAAKAQAGSPVVDRWNEYMKDVMRMEMDPQTGTAYLLEQVFFHP